MTFHKGQRLKLDSEALRERPATGTVLLVGSQVSIAVVFDGTCGIRDEFGDLIVSWWVPLINDRDKGEIRDLWGNQWTVQPLQ